MRVVFLAVDDEFAGLMQQYLYERHAGWIVGSVLSSTPVHRMSLPAAALFLVRKSGPDYVWQMFKMKIVRKLARLGQTPLPSTLAARRGIEVHRTADINSPKSLEKLREWRPDLAISTNFSHYVGKSARELPRFGTWNLHKSYLPSYRGMAPNFHALLEGAPHVGATLHVMAKGFDTGDILAQVKVPVRPLDSVYELNLATSDAGGRLLADFLETFDPRRVVATPQPEGAWRSYSYPTRDQVRAFRRKGLRF